MVLSHTDSSGKGPKHRPDVPSIKVTAHQHVSELIKVTARDQLRTNPEFLEIHRVDGRM